MTQTPFQEAVAIIADALIPVCSDSNSDALGVASDVMEALARNSWRLVPPARIPVIDDLPSRDQQIDDSFIVPCSIHIPPKRGDDTAWLQISQVTLHNVKGLINNGKTETADRILRHYWRRWTEWNQQ